MLCKTIVSFFLNQKHLKKVVGDIQQSHTGWAPPSLISREIKSMCFSFIYTRLTEILFSESAGTTRKLSRLCFIFICFCFSIVADIQYYISIQAVFKSCCPQLGSGLGPRSLWSASLVVDFPCGTHKVLTDSELLRSTQTCEGSGRSTSPAPCLGQIGIRSSCSTSLVLSSLLISSCHQQPFPSGNPSR